MIGHDFKEFRKNFADNTLRAICECGWSVEATSHEDGRDQHAAHYNKEKFKEEEFAEPQAEKVTSIALAAVTQADKDAANYFRELADRIDAGDIGNIVVAFNDKTGNHYERYGNWKDRWTILGAIEYMKFTIDKVD